MKESLEKIYADETGLNEKINQLTTGNRSPMIGEVSFIEKTGLEQIAV